MSVSPVHIDRKQLASIQLGEFRLASAKIGKIASHFDTDVIVQLSQERLMAWVFQFGLALFGRHWRVFKHVLLLLYESLYYLRTRMPSMSRGIGLTARADGRFAVRVRAACYVLSQRPCSEKSPKKA